MLCAQSLTHVPLFATPQTVAHQAPLSMGLPRQEHWSGLPFPSPGNRPNPGIEPMSLLFPALTGRFFTTSTTWEAPTVQSWIQVTLWRTGRLEIFGKCYNRERTFERAVNEDRKKISHLHLLREDHHDQAAVLSSRSRGVSLSLVTVNLILSSRSL